MLEVSPMVIEPLEFLHSERVSHVVVRQSCALPISRAPYMIGYLPIQVVEKSIKRDEIPKKIELSTLIDMSRWKLTELVWIMPNACASLIFTLALVKAQCQ